MHSTFSSLSLGWLLSLNLKHILVSCFKKERKLLWLHLQDSPIFCFYFKATFYKVVWTGCVWVLTSHSLLRLLEIWLPAPPKRRNVCQQIPNDFLVPFSGCFLGLITSIAFLVPRGWGTAEDSPLTLPESLTPRPPVSPPPYPSWVSLSLAIPKRRSFSRPTHCLPPSFLQHSFPR